MGCQVTPNERTHKQDAVPAHLCRTDPIGMAFQHVLHDPFLQIPARKGREVCKQTAPCLLCERVWSRVYVCVCVVCVCVCGSTSKTE